MILECMRALCQGAGGGVRVQVAPGELLWFSGWLTCPPLLQDKAQLFPGLPAGKALLAGP